MVKRIPSCPVNQANVGVDQGLAVIVEFAARIEQHVRDSGHGDEIANRIVALGQRGTGYSGPVIADAVGGRVAKSDSAARQADLAQHRRHRNPGPERLFAVVLTRQRPRQGNHRPPARHVPGQGSDLLCGQAADVGCPLRILDRSVNGSIQVCGKPFVSACVFRKKGAIGKIFRVKDVGNAEQNCRIGVGARGQPRCQGIVVDIGSHRAHVDDFQAASGCLLQVFPLRVPPNPAGIDLPVLERNAAKRNQQTGMTDDRRPAGGVGQEHVDIAQDVRKDDFAGGKTVGIDGSDIPAYAIEETVNLALRMVKPACARPSIGSGIDGAVSVVPANAVEFVRDNLLGFLPGDPDERVCTAPIAGRPRPQIEPALSNGRCPDSGRAVENIDDSRADRRDVRVLFESVQCLDSAVSGLDPVCSPVRRGERQRKAFIHGRYRRIG